jgi:hypothetical protein
MNVIVTVPALNESAVATFRFAEILLPRPQQVFSFLGTDVSSDLQGEAGKASSGIFSAIQLFEYKVTGNMTDITLAAAVRGGPPFFWRSESGVSITGADNIISVLHVLNEPEVEVDDNHVLEEFRRSAAIYGVNLSLSQPAQLPNTHDPLPQGLLSAELLSADKRQSRVFEMIGLIRQEAENVRVGGSIGGGRVCGPIQGMLEQVRL